MEFWVYLQKLHKKQQFSIKDKVKKIKYFNIG